MKQTLIKILLPLMLLFACLGFAACDDGELPGQLSAPENLRVEDGVLYWDEVEDADAYFVEIEGEGRETTECRYDLTFLNESKTYTINVTAISKAGIGRSDISTTTYTKKDDPSATDLEFFQNGRNAYMVSKFAASSDGTCVVPATYQGVPVTGFKFEDTPDTVLSRIKNLYLPNCILEAYLKGEVFRTLPNLERIEMEAGNEKYVSVNGCLINQETKALVVGCIGGKIPDEVTKIGEYAFTRRNVKEVTLPEKVTEIEGYAFFGCSAMTEINFSSNLEKIGWAAFSACTSLESVTLPDSVTTFGAYVFMNCTALKSIKLSENCKSVGLLSFGECSALTEIIIPNGTQQLGLNVFAACTSLKSIVLPTSLTSILNSVFNNCPLEEVYYAGTEAEWNENVKVSEKGNEALLSATRYYYSETPPEENGNYWRYVNGVPTKW